MTDPTKGLDVDSPWQTRRLPDPVRAAALANAVDLCRNDTDVSTYEVIQVAKEFEKYLTGTEAD